VTAEQPGFTQLRYLVVEDDTSMRQVVQFELSQLGITRTTACASALEASNALDNSTDAAPFDIIISDWNMPFMSGLDLLKKCRNYPRFRHIGFLMITSVNEVSHIKDAVAAGVDNYIVKPVTRDLLKEKLQMIFDKRFTKKPG